MSYCIHVSRRIRSVVLWMENIYHSCSSSALGNEFLNCGKSVIMCSRPACPNCPGSLFTFIHHYPPVIVANAHCSALVSSYLNEHVRRNRFTIPIFFQRRPYCLQLLFPRSDRSFALLTHEKIDSWVPHALGKVLSVQWILDISWQNLVFSQFIKDANLVLSTG